MVLYALTSSNPFFYSEIGCAYHVPFHRAPPKGIARAQQVTMESHLKYPLRQQDLLQTYITPGAGTGV